MTYVRRNPAKLAAVVGAACLLVSGGTAVAADPAGGSGYGSPDAQYGPGGTGGVQYGAPVGEVGSPALHAIPVAMLGGPVQFGGTAAPGSAVTIQRLDPHTGQWIEAATAQADPAGNFTATWRADHIGVFTVRALPAGSDQAHTSQAGDTIRMTVYKPALATWYGPGFYGHRTACGMRMTRDLLGVAHRGLPCGTQVALYYHGRTVTVPVVDRGPYGRRDAAYDLTAATARALDMTETSRIGAVSLRTTR